MSDVATDLVALGADVEWTDADAAAAARAGAATGIGRLAQLVEWQAATQRRYPPTAPVRARCVVVGAIADPVAALADSMGVGAQAVDAPSEPFAALAGGIAAADNEIEAGADLLVVAAGDTSTAAAVVVGLVSGAEPIALLPRGAAAIDTAAWIARAEYLRDSRRRIAGLRGRPGELLDAIGDADLAATAALVLRAVSRRTPVVLDGSCAVAAALLCYDTQPRSGRWWQIADTSPDPVHTRAAEELGQQPLLDLGIGRGDGTAGLLALTVLRAAVAVGGRRG